MILNLYFQLYISTFQLGLRTLAVAARRLSSDEYEEIVQKLNDARQVMVDREIAVSRVFSFIENGMTLLGATGVEDQLQDGVPETLEALRAAGIKVCSTHLTFIFHFHFSTITQLLGVGFNGRQIGNCHKHCLFVWSF